MNKRLFLWLVALLAVVSMQAAQLPPVHKTAETATWRLTLQSYGGSRIDVIKVVKEHLGLSLGEAANLVDSAPCVLLENEEYEPAKWFYDDLVAAGATATLIDTDPEVTYTPPTYTGYATYNVVLENAGPQKLEVIKAVKEYLGIGLKEAKDLVDYAPSTLLENVDYETASELFNALAALGATVQLVPLADADPADPSGTWMTTISTVLDMSALIVYLRDECGYSLSEAYDLAHRVPIVVLCGVSYDESIALTKAINNGGFAKAFTMRLEDGNMLSPSVVTTSNFTVSGATVGWTAGGDESQWIVRYGLPADVESGGTTPSTMTWDFESTESGLDGWTTIDADGDGFGWIYENALLHSPHYRAYSGNGLVYSQSYDGDTGTALTPDNWLVSPKLTLGGVFKFWAVGQDANYCNENFAVYVSTTGNTNPSSFVKVSEEFQAIGEYVEYTIDLRAYTGEGYVAIRHFNVTDEFALDIDLITYEPPLITNDNYSDNWQYALNVTDNPYALEKLNSDQVYVVQVMALSGNCNNVSGWSSSAFVKTSALLPPTELFAFNVKQDRVALSWSPGCGENMWHVRYWKTQEPDESFESGALGDDWNIFDEDGDSYTWEVYNESSYAHTGRCSLVANDAYGDDWVVLPATCLNKLLTFWAWGYSNSSSYDSNRGYFAVYVSTTNDNVSSFIQVTPTWKWPSSYEQFSVNLQDVLDTDELCDMYLGQEGYIAIRAWGGLGGCWLFVDDISIMSSYFNGETMIDPWVDEWNQTDNGWHDLTDLDMNTYYSVQVQGQLPNGEHTPWSDILNFKTWSDIVFMNDGEWTDPDCWFNEEVPPSDSDVIIAAECEIPAGFTALTKGLSIADALGLITVKEGGQLKAYPEDRKRVWLGVEKHFKANTYYYLRVMRNFYFPEEMLEGSYTLEYFDQDYGWTSVSPKTLLTNSANGNTKYYCFRYRRTTDLTVELRGTPPTANTFIYAPLTTSIDATYGNYNVVGNTFPCEAWLCTDNERTVKKPYYVMNDEGELQPASGPLDPLQAVFVLADGPKDNFVYFSIGEPIYDHPVSVPSNISVSSIGETSANVNWTANGGEVMWNVRYRESDNGTTQTWDFEDGNQNWTTIDGDNDGREWHVSPSDLAFDGWRYMESYASSSTDNWLISPKVELGGIFSCWARCNSNYYDERFTVYTSPNNFDTANFQQASMEFKVNTSEWTPFSVDLSDIGASGKGYIAIRHHNGESGDYLLLDGISYMTYPESGYIAAGDWRTANKIGSMVYTMKGLKPHTRYDVQVQSIFEGDGRISEWSPIVQFTTGEGAATGIMEHDAIQSAPTETYDLQGRRVNSKPQQGIYLRKGHKFVVK